MRVDRGRYMVRTVLLESEESGRKGGRNVERVLEEIEIEVKNQAEGVNIIEGITEYLEDEGFNVDDDE